MASSIVALAMMLQAPVSLPATPQGNQVQAFIAALNAGEAAFMKFQDEHMLPKKTSEQQKTMFARVRKGMGTFKVLAVTAASAAQISLTVAHESGTAASVTFEFEKAAPYRIINMFVDIGQGSVDGRRETA